MLQIYNTLSRQKEYFRPLHEGHVGMYVCGPTVYGDAHLGHAHSALCSRGVGDSGTIGQR